MKFLIDALFKSGGEEKSPDTGYVLRVATATLLLEVVRADFEIEHSEMEKVRLILRQRFQLNEQELEQMIAEAGEQADRLVSLQHITRQLNEQFDEAEKIRVIEMMWQVVFADGNLDHYEEHLIRQVAELLYLPHSVFIRARHKAEPPVM
ncbi:MAG: TerB family tellurite resistance protein [Gammaproteobacteria bacterium]|nr:TerB family tellurite resistance protein [Gammaproteobacteria bacterium]